MINPLGCNPMDFLDFETFKMTLDFQGWVDLELVNVTLHIQRRPAYCDRGKFLVIVHRFDHTVLTIDEEDKFPRYYFLLENMISELNEWMRWRHQPLSSTSVLRKETALATS